VGCNVKIYLTYEPKHSIEVLTMSERFVETNPDLVEQIRSLYCIYEAIQWAVPQTQENFGSGHVFPIVESWQEMQVSYNLCMFGFYKQAMVSLRSAFELGLLNVYWNLNDNGHLVIKNWLQSTENTPRFKDIWKQLESDPRILMFQKSHDVKSQLKQLGYLHEYVHTAGYYYSSEFKRIKTNYQTFDERAFRTWLKSASEVTKMVCLLHVIKYPVIVIRSDYDAKFGIDRPLCVMDEHIIQSIEKLLGGNYMKTVYEIANEDPTVKWLKSLPDLSEDERDNTIIEYDKVQIERMGLYEWLEKEKKGYGDEWESDKIQARIELLSKWAHEKGFLRPMMDRFSNED